MTDSFLPYGRQTIEDDDIVAVSQRRSKADHADDRSAGRTI